MTRLICFDHLGMYQWRIMDGFQRQGACAHCRRTRLVFPVHVPECASEPGTWIGQAIQDMKVAMNAAILFGKVSQFQPASEKPRQ